MRTRNWVVAILLLSAACERMEPCPMGAVARPDLDSCVRKANDRPDGGGRDADAAPDDGDPAPWHQIPPQNVGSSIASDAGTYDARVIDSQQPDAGGTMIVDAAVTVANDAGSVAPDGNVTTSCGCGIDPRESAWLDVTPAGTAHQNTPITALSTVTGGASLFWSGPNGEVRSTYMDARITGVSWAPWFELAEAGAAQAGALVTAVSAVPGGSSLFWVGEDGSLRSTFYDPRSAEPSWASWFSISAAGAADPGSRLAALASNDGSVSLYWSGADGSIRSTFYDTRFSGQGWVPWIALTGPGAADGYALAAVSTVDRGAQLYWFDRNGALASMFYDPRWSEPAWTEPFVLSPAGEAATPSAIAAISAVAGGTSVFWVDRRGAVRSTSYDPRQSNPVWALPFDLVRPDSALPALGTPSAVVALEASASLFWVEPGGTLQGACYDLCPGAPLLTASKVGARNDALAGATLTSAAIRESNGAVVLSHATVDGRVRVLTSHASR
jgi:hypothetical protein